MSNKFKFANIFSEEEYLSKFCETLFEKYNFKEEPAFKGMPERMAYEAEIWIIGAAIMQKMKDLKNKKNDYSTLLKQIITIIQTEKYNSGRESFVMTLHYFKDNPAVESTLRTLLDDKQLYGFALKELNKSKLYNYKEKVEGILKNEKKSWIKKEAERYLKNSN